MNEIVYCDASFGPNPESAIIGIMCGKAVLRIKVRAKNSTSAELLSVILAHRIHPGKLIVNDCKVVTDMFNHHLSHRLFNAIGKSLYRTMNLMHKINQNGIQWMPRCSSEETKIVDALTRKQISPNFRRFLKMNEFTLQECIS